MDLSEKIIKLRKETIYQQEQQAEQLGVFSINIKWELVNRCGVEIEFVKRYFSMSQAIIFKLQR